MNILYWDTSKGDPDQIRETATYLQQRGFADILVLPDYTYLQKDCSKEVLIWWRDKINEIIEGKENEIPIN